MQLCWVAVRLVPAKITLYVALTPLTTVENLAFTVAVEKLPVKLVPIRACQFEGCPLPSVVRRVATMVEPLDWTVAKPIDEPLTVRL